VIRAFWQSRLAAAVVVVVSLGIVALIWIRNQANPVYIPVVATLLMFGIAYFTARLLGNIVANIQNTNRLGLLHMELNPDAFLKRYVDVVQRLRPGSRERAIAGAYLADGYAAAGQFDQALETLQANFSSRNGDLALSGLYYHNLCTYFIAKGDLNGARQAADELEKIVAACWDKRAALAQNLKESLTLHRTHIACAAGEKIDTKWLQGQLDKATYKLRKLEISQMLAQSALAAHDFSAARRYLSNLSTEGGKTYYKRWAAQQFNRLQY
jgi:hypothetical protein